MKNQRLIHDTAMPMAQAAFDVVVNCIHPSSHKDALEEFYKIAVAGLEAYCVQAQRIQHRLRPMNN